MRLQLLVFTDLVALLSPNKQPQSTIKDVVTYVLKQLSNKSASEHKECDYTKQDITHCITELLDGYQTNGLLAVSGFGNG